MSLTQPSLVSLTTKMSSTHCNKALPLGSTRVSKLSLKAEFQIKMQTRIDSWCTGTLKKAFDSLTTENHLLSAGTWDRIVYGFWDSRLPGLHSSIHSLQVLHKSPLCRFAIKSYFTHRKYGRSHRRVCTWNNHARFQQIIKHRFDAFNCFTSERILITTGSAVQFRCDYHRLTVVLSDQHQPINQFYL